MNRNTQIDARLLILPIGNEIKVGATELPFWRNWVIGSFEDTTGQKKKKKNEWIDPFPVGVN